MFHKTFESDASAPRMARAFVESKLNPRMCTEGALLAVSELVTNVILHDPDSSELTVSVDIGRDDVRIAVSGNAQGPLPIKKAPTWPDPKTPHGRGLNIVDAVSNRWGVEPNGSPTVWCEIAC